MKKTSLAVALPALALTGLLLSGCGMFRSTKAWDTAKQESPLEIPPGLDTPTASEALVIPPPGANQPTSSGATSRFGVNGGVISDGFVLASSVDDTYGRVAKALQSGAIGTVQSHDDSAHTYALDVTAAPLSGHKEGFFHRMFHHDSKQAKGAATYPVQVSVATSGQNGSEVRAQGNAAAVAKVIGALKSSLGVR
ncbi:hypothetical protein [Dyella sp. A6]|uniref:hypothetical protein n=1 Tax=Dyella aluminiiresistens TaxID=3069105 RepID=UPI002E78C79B|nr:hypothetical protein [Dyella sp. A6]